MSKITKGWLSETRLGIDADPSIAVPITANTFKMPFSENNLTAIQTKGETAVLTGRRAASKKYFQNIDVTGGMTVPFDAKIVGLIGYGVSGGTPISKTVAAAMTANDIVTRANLTKYHVGAIVKVDATDSFFYVAKEAGTSAAALPNTMNTVEVLDYVSTPGETVVDGGVTWLLVAKADLYFHVFKPSKAAVPMFWNEKALITTTEAGVETDEYFVYRGLKMNSVSFSASFDGNELTTNIDWIGRDVNLESDALTINAGAISDFTTGRQQFQSFKTRISAFTATSDDALTAELIQDIAVEINNNIEVVRTINSAGYAYELVEGQCVPSGSVTALFADKKAYEIAKNGTSAEVAVAFIEDSDITKFALAQFRFPEVELEPFDVPISGAGVVTASFNWSAYQEDITAGAAPVVITVVNAHPNYKPA
jgi:hypothetical protein